MILGLKGHRVDKLNLKHNLKTTSQCLKLVQGMTFGYPTSGMVLGLKGQRSRLGLVSRAI